jgi:hypothetical protein
MLLLSTQIQVTRFVTVRRYDKFLFIYKLTVILLSFFKT